MCRMLVAAGRFPMAQLLDNFKLIALNRNEIHERNRNNRNYIHDSGWGIVLGKSGILRESYKKDIPCWKDPRFLNYYNDDFDFVILHARKASGGSPVSLSYTHPFEREGWYFCHNGTITKPHPQERRDSEQFFLLLLDCLQQSKDTREAIRNAVNQLEEYTAINFILANETKAYTLVKYTQDPEYYTMKYLQNKDFAIVSSEVLPNFQGKWEKIKNDTLLELDIASGQIAALSF